MLTQFTNVKIMPTLKDVVDAINFACYDNRQESSKDLVNAFKTSGTPCMKGKSKARCSNCGMCHDISECWSEGGRACGKALEWWKVKQAEKSKTDAKKADKKSKNKGKDKANAATHNDSNDSCVESANVFQHHPTDGYLSCTALDSEEHDRCSVIWDSHTALTPPNIANQNQMAVNSDLTASMLDANSGAYPFYCNSGATSHVSPVRSDFLELMQIPAHQVCGMNGSSISAVRRGKIRLHCRKGRVLTLVDALYVPAATLRLISVGQLCENRLIAVFDATGCSFQTNAGKIVAGGTCTGKDLYLFKGNSPHIERANISHAIPNLETWHRHLGHTNYQAVFFFFFFFFFYINLSTDRCSL